MLLHLSEHSSRTMSTMPLLVCRCRLPMSTADVNCHCSGNNHTYLRNRCTSVEARHQMVGTLVLHSKRSAKQDASLSYDYKSTSIIQCCLSGKNEDDLNTRTSQSKPRHTIEPYYNVPGWSCFPVAAFGSIRPTRCFTETVYEHTVNPILQNDIFESEAVD